MKKKQIMAYVHQLLDQPSQWQTSQQAGPGSVPKFTSTSITVKQLLIKNINQSKSSLIDMTKRPRGRAVSAPDFGSRGRGFESHWRRDSSRT